MKIIIAGSRKLGRHTDKELVWLVADAVIKSGWRHQISEVVSGHARGVDLAGEFWADSAYIKTTTFPADWEAFGKAAGHMRNELMADYADALIAIWDGSSRGTRDMIKRMKDRNKPAYVYLVPVESQ